jgi:hypothetical protein
MVRVEVGVVRHSPYSGERNEIYDRKTSTEVTARNIKNVNGTVS